MPGRSGANPYGAGEGTNNHVLLLNKGTKTHGQLDVGTDIHALSLKAVPANDDEIAIDDSADSYNRKKVKVSSISGTGEYYHDRLHAISSTSDHSSVATPGRMLKADANGLPAQATNTDTEVSDAVSKKHDSTNDPTTGQKAALVGTSGTPGYTNKYVTNNDPRNTNSRTPASHGNEAHSSAFTTLPLVKADTDIADAIAKKHAHVPSNMDITRDGDGNITQMDFDDERQYTITRNAYGIDHVTLVGETTWTITRDGNGVITGIVVT